MQTAKEIAAQFASRGAAATELERDILRHMEHHIVEAVKVERRRCADIADAIMRDPDYTMDALHVAEIIRNKIAIAIEVE